MLFSCKRDYTCNCYDDTGLIGTYEIENETKNSAEETCIEYDIAKNVFPDSYCELTKP